MLSLKTRDYVAAARVAGGGDFRIMYRHILPGVINLLMVLASLRIGGLILAEASLSYLGIGVPSRYPSWGNMISRRTRVPRHRVVGIVLPRLLHILSRDVIQLCRRLGSRQD